MTVSFHKFGEYFPGTGDVKDKVRSTSSCCNNNHCSNGIVI
jgi:hypothetical protein